MAAARKSENPRMMRLDSGYASSDDVPAARGAPQRAITPHSTDDWECETVHDVSSTCSSREWVSSATNTSSAWTLPPPQPPCSKPNPLTNPATAAKFNIKYHIPSPFFYEFHDATAAMRYIYSKCSPSSLIIKDPVSKTSLHPSNIEAAISFLRASNLHDPKVPFDEKRLFIEEFMSGEEAFARVEVQDEGVGMLCSLEVGGVVGDEVMADVQEIAERVLEGLREEGIVTASVIRIRLVLALDGAIVTGYFVDC
ncbi:hypothetical protein BS50DRAFT_638618 [Corynespora cassiicola Philippines]|uniref:Uncharacterized protein n=1 Tax=Corynespora cassiicola Philippines TaxID=1448308 RepID=A0A2T2N9D5_CORCC|nr:hypothetical protein BS50DRAFT_638618 [Corynespora cassiicola Philippines]